MPAGNRMATSAALNTHGIWQNAIGYDPYAPTDNASGADTGARSEAAASAQENMKALMSLATKNKVGLMEEEEEKGGWRGRGKLKGGWAAGKDLGELPKEKAPAASAFDDDMPSSTSSDTDDDGDDRGGSSTLGGDSRKRGREEEDDKRERREKEAKRSHREKHKSSKHKKEKHRHKSDKDRHRHKEKKHKSDKGEKKHKHHSKHRSGSD